MSKKTPLLLFFTLIFTSLNAEDPKELSLDSGNVDNQFEYVIKKSNNYQQYEVIPKEWMVQLRDQVKDTLNGMRLEKTSLQQELNQRAERIEELTSQLASTRDSLGNSRAAQEEMALLGTPTSKSTYRLIMWSVVGLLFLFLLIFMFRFRRSNVITVRAKENLSNLQEEFDDHRKRSLDREQKLRRELQDELNKQRRQ